MISRNEVSISKLLPTSLRAAIIACSFWVLSLPITVVSGSVAAFCGSLLICYTIDLRLDREFFSKLRTLSIIGLGICLWATGLLLSNFFVNTEIISFSASPIIAFNLSEAIKWLALSSSLTLILRTLAQRTSYGPTIEIIFVAAAFVITLAAHRNGMIHRPFLIGDFAIIRGIDPSSILMVLGCAAVISLSALLMVEKNHKRLPYHFSILGILCLSLFAYVNFFGIPTPQSTDTMGLTGQASDNTNSQRDNPFRDGENENSDREAPVAVVVFRDDYEPINGSYYFRESAYSQFDGTMLDYSNIDGMDADLIKQFTIDRTEAEQKPLAEDQHKAIKTTVGMLVPHRNPFGLESPIAYENIANPNNVRFKRTYDAYSLAPQYSFEYLLEREVGNEEWSEEILTEYLRLPDDDRYRSLADELIGNLKPEFTNDPFAKTWAIKTYLDENGIYSLKNEHAYESDPAASFLFGDLTGYCMHFSFAATYLFRSLGIPSRVGIGYSVPAANRAGGSALLVQAIHGHAWPEVYFKDIGWVIIDPAPQQTLVDMTTDPQDSLQQLLGDMLRNDSSFQDFLESQRTSFIQLGTILNIIYALVIALILIGYVVKTYRLLIPNFSLANERYRVSYRAILDRLACIGIRRRFGESREKFASRASKTAPSIIELTDSHLSCALGNISKWKNHETNWQEFERRIQQEITSNTNIWHRVVGLINPFSWLLTK